MIDVRYSYYEAGRRFLATSLAVFFFTLPLFAQITPQPVAKGEIESLHWELRLNRHLCSHDGRAPTWCDGSDHEEAINESGIESELLSWINNPSTDFIRISYMTFTSETLADALCSAAELRRLPVDIYLQFENIASRETSTGVYKKLIECSEKHPTLRLLKRGTESWLNHAKIFLAAINDPSFEGGQRLHFTSSSANLSQSGLGLHYDNWLFFDAPADHYLARQNLCFFEALENMVTVEQRLDKGLFQNSIQNCFHTIEVPSKAPVRFLAVPATADMERPLASLLDLIRGAKSTIRIAVHKMTQTGSSRFTLVENLVKKLKQGVKVEIVFDDDLIIKELKLPGSSGLNVSRPELEAYRTLLANGADITFIDTNESEQLYMHNKYMIFDDASVFTGAGNFSSASLLGTNTEQFYIIEDEKLVGAYGKAWQELRDWSLPRANWNR
jgi:phosphatidylserine/phosphatidylglycerophosphate/cardiolipin synthase-like enzyme